MIAQNNAPTQVERLNTFALMATVYYRTPRARMLWGRHYDKIGPYPDTFVSADDGMTLLEGLVIDGDWDPDHGWDLNGLFTIITDDAAILNVRGWMACSIEVL